MTHVSSRELSLFISNGVATAEFEGHVDSCPACASRLSAEARVAVAVGERSWWSHLILGSGPLRSPVTALAPVMALCAVLAVLLSPVKASSSPTQLQGSSQNLVTADAGDFDFSAPVVARDDRPADGGAH